VLEHCHEEETNCGSQFFESFPSAQIPKTTKDDNVHFFIHSFIFL
jgi:hypothetical protein